MTYVSAMAERFANSLFEQGKIEVNWSGMTKEERGAYLSAMQFALATPQQAAGSTRFDEVSCEKPAPGCEWPECQCRRKELRGTFACPICGEDTPHHHSVEAEKRPACTGCMNPTCEDCFDLEELAKLPDGTAPASHPRLTVDELALAMINDERERYSLPLLLRSALSDPQYDRVKRFARSAREVFREAAKEPKKMAIERVIDEIAGERRRQIEKGFDVAHDDEHTDGSIAQAAGAYALAGSSMPLNARVLWPWSNDTYDPGSSPREAFIKAAAMLVAEIERLDRQTAQLA